MPRGGMKTTIGVVALGEPALAFGRVGAFRLLNMPVILRVAHAVMLQAGDKVSRSGKSCDVVRGVPG